MPSHAALEHAEVADVVLQACPALVRVPGGGQLLLVVERRRRDVVLLTPRLEVVRVAVADVRDLLCRETESPVREATERWLQPVRLGDHARRRVRDALAAEEVRRVVVTHAYLVRMPPSADFLAQLRFEGVLGRAGWLAGAFAVQLGLGLLGWYTLGSGAFGGSVDRHWLVA